MIETEEQKLARVSKKIQKIMEEEGVVFDIQMVPQMRMMSIPAPTKGVPQVAEVKVNDPAPK